MISKIYKSKLRNFPKVDTLEGDLRILKKAKNNNL